MTVASKIGLGIRRELGTKLSESAFARVPLN
jgi:hypothetical protein